VGYDLHYWRKLKGGGQNAARGFLLNDGTTATSYIPENAADYQTITYSDNTLPRPNVDHFDLENPTYTIRNVQDYTLNSRIAIPSALTTNNAFYLQEQLRYKRITLLLGLRGELFKDITNYKTPKEASFKNEKLLPRIGITYAVNDNINVYGTYLESFQPQSNTVGLMPGTGNFFWSDVSAAFYKPLISDLREVGVKATIFNNKLNFKAAIYEINQKNILMDANDPSQPDLLVQRGADRSRGFECDLTGYLRPNWQIIASYSYIDAKIVNDTDPDLIGKRKENTPKNSANLWTRYNFKDILPLKDLGVGLGVQYQSGKIPWFTRSFEVPSFTVFDAAFYYAPNDSNIEVALNVGNIFNTTHWLGAQNYLRLFPGAPRNASLTLSYTF
jgi:iron complex outermembrane receptor protein